MVWHPCGIQHGCLCGIQYVCVVSDVGLQVCKTRIQTRTYKSCDWRKFGQGPCVNHWSMLLPDFLEIFLTGDSLDSVSQMVLRIGSLIAPCLPTRHSIRPFWSGYFHVVLSMVLRIVSFIAAQGRKGRRGWVPGRNRNKSHEFALND